MKLIIFQLILIFKLLSLCEACNQDSDCSESEVCDSRECKNACENIKCGIEAKCIVKKHITYCKCKRNRYGNPLEKCWQLGVDPCDPNPCGPNSICKVGEFGGMNSRKKNGTYCLCGENSLGNPPNCYPMCNSHDDCKDEEFCDSFSSRKCVNPCDDEFSPCNKFYFTSSKCRVENHLPYCSCPEGFTPKVNEGCKEKKQYIPIDEIKNCLMEKNCDTRTCADYCYDPTKCNIFNNTLECYSSYLEENPFLPSLPSIMIPELPCKHSKYSMCGKELGTMSILALAGKS